MKLIRRIAISVALLAIGAAAGYLARPVLADRQHAMTKADVEREVARQTKNAFVDCRRQNYPTNAWSCSVPPPSYSGYASAFAPPPEYHAATVIGQRVTVDGA